MLCTYVSRDAARAAYETRGQFNAIDPEQEERLGLGDEWGGILRRTGRE